MEGARVIGIVVVSHSRALARAAVELAQEMVPPPRRPPIATAAGLEDDAFGTDAQAIAHAIDGLRAQTDGVLVLLDLGSAILSAEMALEFVDDGSPVRLSPAPLVEGLVAAYVTASGGGGLDAVAADAENGLVAKSEQLSADPVAVAPGGPFEPATAPDATAEPPAALGPDAAADPDAAAEPHGLTWAVTLITPDGLHARPAARLAQAVQDLDATVLITDVTNGRGPVDAESMLLLTTLGARQGDELTARISGPDAERALAALHAWADEGHGR